MRTLTAYLIGVVIVLAVLNGIALDRLSKKCVL